MGTSKIPNIIFKNPTQTIFCYETAESKWEGFNRIKVFRSSLILFTFLNYLSHSQNVDLTAFVKPIIGTNGHGHVFPGPTMPFGMVQLSPDNKSNSAEWDWCSGYHYSDSLIVGFSHTHLSGTGVADLGDILIMPSVGVNLFETPDVKSYVSAFSHQNENVKLGYYSVFLNRPKVKAELTVSKRTGFHQYTFPKSDSSAIVIDLAHKIFFGNTYESSLKVLNDSTLVGQKNTMGGWAQTRKVFFSIQFSKPFFKSKFAKKHESTSVVRENSGFIKENEPKIAFYFKTLKDEKIKIKVALSPVSIENATKNLKEINHWDFEKQVKEVNSVWNKELNKIVIEGTIKQKEIFYTSLYHAMIAPNLVSDSDGSYYGPDFSPHISENKSYFSTFSLWDTYRAAHPLFTILVPDLAQSFVENMLEHFKYNFYLPIWTLWGTENHCMIANHSIPVITDAYFKGILPKSKGKEAYNAMLVSSTIEHNKSDWNTYNKFGYYPSSVWENVSKTLESSYNDWCVLQMAKEFGTPAEINLFEKRANYYKNLFHPSKKFMWPKDEKGNWKIKYNPKEVTDGWRDVTEGNSWQYTWSVQHDPKGLIQLFGGEKPFLSKLDSTFDENNKAIIEQLDVTGLIGEYAHGNEPSHHIAYLYNYAGKPKNTAKIIRKIYETQYNNTPDGLCGNEDCGQMSAWFIFNTLGMYPLNPANGKYDLSAPQVPSATINLPNGNIFKIIAKDISDKNKFVKSITLNKKPYSLLYLNHQDLIKGGELVFQMSDK